MTTPVNRAAEVVIVGGGIAGMSLAAELVRYVDGASILLLEREDQLAYHTTGRSVAAYLQTYGSAEIRALTRASGPIISAVDGPPLLTPRPLLWVTGPGENGLLAHLLAANPTLRPLSRDAAFALCPVLRADHLSGAAVEDTACDVDVAALYQHYRRGVLAAGVAVRTGSQVLGGRRVHSGWTLDTTVGTITARTVVNAAGAWADEVAGNLGVAPAGLTPLRRTAAVARCPQVSPSWPLVADVGESFYFRPESGGLLVSPADEVPSPPCDARPAFEDVALALHRVNEATTLALRSVRTSWAGLRTFASDRNPVAGFDAAVDGFCWLAGQGGYGIQTAPALARLTAALIAGATPPAELSTVDLERLAPDRPRPAVLE